MRKANPKKSFTWENTPIWFNFFTGEKKTDKPIDVKQWMYFDSGEECSFFCFLRKNNIDIIFHPRIELRKGITWEIDFFLTDALVYVEYKGDWIYHPDRSLDREMLHLKHLLASELGKKVIIVTKDGKPIHKLPTFTKDQFLFHLSQNKLTQPATK
jgi:hypothetical protein